MLMTAGSMDDWIGQLIENWITMRSLRIDTETAPVGIKQGRINNNNKNIIID